MKVTAKEARAKWEASVAEWEARTGRSALGEALASQPPNVANSRRVQRNARAIRAYYAREEVVGA